MNRHAFLILAHNNWQSLEKLVEFLRHPDIDIYLHVDKKSKDFDAKRFQGVVVVDRINVHWGTDDMAAAELNLFSAALSNGPYRYYHLISGNDLPLRPIDEILDYFNSRTENFIISDDEPEWEHRLQIYYNLFEKWPLPGGMIEKLNYFANVVQFRLGVNRLRALKEKYPKIPKGYQWASLTQAAVEELVGHKEDIKRFCRFTNCCDETYKQIILSNSDLVDTIAAEFPRVIDWSAGGKHPKTFTIDDFPRLVRASESGMLFARKFDERTDSEIIDKIYDYVSKNK